MPESCQHGGARSDGGGRGHTECAGLSGAGLPGGLADLIQWSIPPPRAAAVTVRGQASCGGPRRFPGRPGRSRARKDQQAAPALQQRIDQFARQSASRTVDIPVPETTTAEGVSWILQAIQSSQLAIETKVGEVCEDVGLLRQDLRTAVGRITEVEGRVSQAEGDLVDLKVKVAQLQTCTGELHRRAEDAENRSRCNNLRFVGFPEGAEENNAIEFLESWIKAMGPCAEALPLVCY
ncbi:hypothetical protein NDU88_006363 [Pleurodeles waltl]|uniref:Uncharacterized protein n=1 Tax=Pleurodeles waltl TaxID=8319 RepID=A0AAV7QKK9_PLEWA|nr:hypothetical protein NDU88_006363 [Pleurodeles waltl]